MDDGYFSIRPSRNALIEILSSFLKIFSFSLIMFASSAGILIVSSQASSAVGAENSKFGSVDSTTSSESAHHGESVT